jgi:hypothetical protein
MRFGFFSFRDLDMRDGLLDPLSKFFSLP